MAGRFTVEGAKALLPRYADAGVAHVILRFVGEHERHLQTLAGAT
jgi:hypothetical protein